jgi:hypothetical protein
VRQAVATINTAASHVQSRQGCGLSVIRTPGLLYSYQVIRLWGSMWSLDKGRERIFDCELISVIGRLLRNMEGRKKGAKELLEERQMKRYFRSKKRSKGKNKKDYDNLNEVKESKITKAISIAAVEDQIGEMQNKDTLMKIPSESKNEPPQDDSQKGRVKDDSTEDLSDWEIVPHLAENRSKNIVPETPSDVLSGMESGMDSIEDELVEIIDQNKEFGLTKANMRMPR